MRLLLDSHTLIWAVDDPAKLSTVAVAALQDPANELSLSAATVWEISIKVGLGKLTLNTTYRDWMNAAIAALGLNIVPITVDFADAQSQLPHYHRDPFDRLLAAQSLAGKIPLISADSLFDRYGVTRIW